MAEFYEIYAEHILIPAPVVEDFHAQLVKYLTSPDTLFLIRQMKNQPRGEISRIKNGSRIRFTDNTPAWWLHYQLFTGQYSKMRSFQEFIETAPSHMFDIKIHGHINDAGWSVAHIFDVKDRNTDFQNWSKKELIKRTVRNIHPCNYFYISKHDRTWDEYGKDKNFLSFFYEKFSMKYRTIWNDFMRMIAAKPLKSSKDIHIIYSYSSSKKNNIPKESSLSKHKSATDQSRNKDHRCKVQYESSRLCFKADLIEPLGWDEYFCVITKEGTFKLSKRDFYAVFPNVVNSKSYQEERIYHYPKIPKKAERFVV